MCTLLSASPAQEFDRSKYRSSPTTLYEHWAFEYFAILLWWRKKKKKHGKLSYRVDDNYKVFDVATTSKVNKQWDFGTMLATDVIAYCCLLLQNKWLNSAAKHGSHYIRQLDSKQCNRLFGEQFIFFGFYIEFQCKHLYLRKSSKNAQIFTISFPTVLCQKLRQQRIWRFMEVKNFHDDRKKKCFEKRACQWPKNVCENIVRWK